MSGFQTQVSTTLAPGIAGDFASANFNKYTTLNGPGGAIAGLSGLVQGRFAWLSNAYQDYDSAAAIANNTGTGVPSGFVHRDQQALNTIFLAEATMLMPSGFPVSIFNDGDFWVKNDGANQALPGQKVYANYADGKATTAATANPAVTSFTAAVAASTLSVTGSITGNVLNVTAVGSGTVVNGATLAGTGVVTGTKVVSQISGTLGGVGTYAVNYGEQTVAAGTTITGTYGTMTVSAVASGVLGVGAVLLTGTSVVVGTAVAQLLTGAGGTGTYVVDNNTVVSSTAITAGTNVETKWICRSSALPGEVFKMSPIS